MSIAQDISSKVRKPAICANTKDCHIPYVVVSHQRHRITSVLRLVLTQISGIVFDCYFCNAIPGNQDVSVIFLQFLNITLQNSDKYPPSHHVQAADGNS